MILLLQVAVILAAARLVRMIASPLGQPAVIGEMVAGLLLGPTAFGWLIPELSEWLFPSSTLSSLNALSQIGLVLFMFLVGLRLGAESLRSKRRIATVTSVTSIIVPFVLGAWLASVVHGRLAPQGLPVLPFALFIGTAMSITAFPVLARILVESRLLSTDIGTIAIACAAFDDVAGWMILAGVMSLVRAGGASVLLARMVLFVVYLAIMMVLVRPALGWWARRRGTELCQSADDLVVVLLVLLLSSVATDALGVHALFGAFFAGLAMPRDQAIERMLRERVEPLTTTLLLPLFFALTGLRTKLQLIDSTSLWLDAALILGVAVIGKAGGSTLAARWMGMTWRDAGVLGILLNTRGLIELVVLNIGFDLGILPPVIFSMLVLMALVTTFMTAPLVSYLRLVPTASTAGIGMQ